jgi:hypothetical protein
MLHACLYTICFVFCYTSWRFYVFSGTNLLTRCHSASSLLDETKAKPSIFSEASQSPKMRRRGARSQAHPRAARPSPWSCHQGVRPAGPPFDAPLSPIYFPRWEKPRERIASPRNILQDVAVLIARSGGSRSSSRHPTGEGNPYRRPSPPPWSPPE